MEQTRAPKNDFKLSLRRARTLALVLSVVSAGVCTPHLSQSRETIRNRHTRDSFRIDLARTVRANHPAIAPVAAAIRAVTLQPLEQLCLVNDVTHLLVDYDDDVRVYGADEYHATLEEMLARRRQAGWLYLRDDCDGRAIFAAHLLAALGIEWRLEASYWKEHAWIVARVNGREYDLLDLRGDAPETNRLSFKLLGRHFVRPTIRPPAFAWRRAWAQRTNRDLQTGITLGLLTVDSRATAQQERFATDWTSVSPEDTISPLDNRALSMTVAGFPYGEPLHIAAIASLPPAPKQAQSPALGVSTGSANSTAP